MPMTLEQDYTPKTLTNQDIQLKNSNLVSYTIKPFIFLSFPLNIKSDAIITNKNGSSYKRIFEMHNGYKIELVIFSKTQQIPYGIYARRLMSYFCKQVLLTKSQTISIGSDKKEFFENILGITYKLSNNNTKTVFDQIEAFFNCFISIQQYKDENFDYKLENVNLFSKVKTEFWNQNNEWTSTVTLTQEFYNAILDFPVPINQHYLENNTNSRKIDIYNYLHYQNYLACKKRTDLFFPIKDLKELFGYDVTSDKKFRETFLKTLEEILAESTLNVIKFGIKGYKLYPRNEALLVNKIVDTNAIKLENIKLVTDSQQEIINNLKSKYTKIEIEAAITYAISQNPDNLKSYVNATLKKGWHNKIYNEMYEKILKIEKMKFEELHKSEQIQLSKEIMYKIKNGIVTGSDEIKYVAKDLFTGRKNNLLQNTITPEYLGYLWWIFKNDKFATSNNDYKLIYALFNHVKDFN